MEFFFRYLKLMCQTIEINVYSFFRYPKLFQISKTILDIKIHVRKVGAYFRYSI